MHRLLLFAIAVICLPALVICECTSAKQITTIAVVPFVNVTRDPSVDWIGTGFAETISTKLCNVSGIHYVERFQLSRAMKEMKLQETALVDPATAGKLGRLVGAGHVVIGSYQKVGNQLKVDARVVEVETARADRSTEEVGTMDMIFDIQASLASQLIEALGKKPTEAETKAIAEPPTNSAAAYEWFAKGQEYWLEDRYSDAIEAYGKAIGLDPSYVEAYRERARLNTVTEMYDSAIKDYSKAISLTPDCWKDYKDRALAYTLANDYDRAIKDYARVFELSADDVESYEDRGDIYSIHKKDYGNAIADYSKAIELDPTRVSAYESRRFSAAMKGDYDLAITDSTKLIEMKPDLAYSNYDSRGRAYLEKGNIEQALADCNKAIELKPDYTLAFSTRARCYESQKDYKHAISDRTKIIESQPSDGIAYCFRGVDYYKRGDNDNAIKDFSKAIQLNPNAAYAYLSRGDTYRAKGDKNKALTDYSKVIELYPKECALAYYGRGIILAEKGDIKRAAEDLRRYLVQAEPGDANIDAAKRKLKTLEK